MRLLLIEDDPTLVRSLDRALREAGYRVDTAVDGDEGLQKALVTDYQLIVLDAMLPKRDGWSLLAALRATKQTPVLMLTARDTSDDRVRGLDLGADDYLVKPFDLEVLLARLRALIRRTQRNVPARRVFGTIEINSAACQVRKGGENVVLTAREFALLQCLAENANSVVERRELYRHLFDEDDNTLSNLLDVHVSNLRKKLGADLIETVRGEGYRLVAQD